MGVSEYERHTALATTSSGQPDLFQQYGPEANEPLRLHEANTTPAVYYNQIDYRPNEL